MSLAGRQVAGRKKGGKEANKSRGARVATECGVGLGGGFSRVVVLIRNRSRVHHEITARLAPRYHLFRGRSGGVLYLYLRCPAGLPRSHDETAAMASTRADNPSPRKPALSPSPHLAMAAGSHTTTSPDRRGKPTAPPHRPPCKSARSSQVTRRQVRGRGESRCPSRREPMRVTIGKARGCIPGHALGLVPAASSRPFPGGQVAVGTYPWHRLPRLPASSADESPQR